MFKQMPNSLTAALSTPRRRTVALVVTVVAAMVVASTVYQSGRGLPNMLQPKLAAPSHAGIAYLPAENQLAADTSVNGVSASAGAAVIAEPASVHPSSAVARMVIEQASLDMTTTHQVKAAQRASDLATSLGGFVESMQSTSDSHTTVSVTVRVPETAFRRYLSELKSNGTVSRFSESGQDVTQQYSGLQDTLSELRNEQVAYTRLFKQATSMKDMLQIQQSLSDVSSQIASYETQAHNLQRSVDLARVNVTFTPVAAPVNHPFGTTNQIARSLVQSLDALVSSFMALVTLVAWLIPWAFVLGLIVWIMRLRGYHRRPGA